MNENKLTVAAAEASASSTCLGTDLVEKTSMGNEMNSVYK